MVYQTKTSPSMTARNIHRRRQRQFRKMVRTHPVLQALLNEPEISKHFFDIQKVLEDFYIAGMNDSMALAIYAVDKAFQRQ